MSLAHPQGSFTNNPVVSAINTRLTTVENATYLTSADLSGLASSSDVSGVESRLDTLEAYDIVVQDDLDPVSDKADENNDRLAQNRSAIIALNNAVSGLFATGTFTDASGNALSFTAVTPAAMDATPPSQ